MITPSEVKKKSASGDSIVIPSPLLVVSVAVAITSVIIINNIIPTIITGHNKAWLFYLLGPRSWPTREGAQPCAESGCTAVTV